MGPSPDHHTSEGPTVLFVHGHGGGPGAFALMQRRLARFGYQRFAGWEYRSTGSVAEKAAALGEFVDTHLRAQPLLIVAHSLGGIVSRFWLQELDGVARAPVKALVTLSTPHQGIRALPGVGWIPLIRELEAGGPLLTSLSRSARRLEEARLPCLSIVSARDHFVRPWTNASFAPARLVPVAHAGHVGVLFSRQVHLVVAEHLEAAAAPPPRPPRPR
jgi:triacylglycerol lipase